MPKNLPLFSFPLLLLLSVSTISELFISPTS